jgi:hypothetical protein
MFFFFKKSKSSRKRKRGKTTTPSKKYGISNAQMTAISETIIAKKRLMVYVDSF